MVAAEASEGLTSLGGFDPGNASRDFNPGTAATQCRALTAEVGRQGDMEWEAEQPLHH